VVVAGIGCVPQGFHRQVEPGRLVRFARGVVRGRSVGCRGIVAADGRRFGTPAEQAPDGPDEPEAEAAAEQGAEHERQVRMRLRHDEALA
jgi:hypothetical protein